MKKKNQMDLTFKQCRFVAEYCVDLNATAAYIRSGYSARGHVAESAASRMLSNVEVQKAITQKQKELASKCDVTAQKVIQEVSALAFFDVRKLFNADGSLKSIHELDDGTAAAISYIEVDDIKSGGSVTGQVRKIKVWDKNSAQERLCKHLGLFREDNRERPVTPNKIEISFVPPLKKSDTNNLS
jgi:phage terminase small subunit